MKIEILPIISITPYARNPRRNEGVPVSKVKASLKEFGWQQPIVVDKDMTIVVGHTRYLAALELGMTEVPVHIADKLTPNQIRAYRIADNKTATFSDWDMDLLALEFDDLKAEGFDLDLTGFDADELAGIDLNSEPESEGDTEPQTDRADELREQWGVEVGDLWALGDHRLLCGDSTKAEDVGRVLGDDKPHLMVTDPPYGVEYSNSKGMVTNDDNFDWTKTWSLFDGNIAYIWHGERTALDFGLQIRDAGFDIRSRLIWVKPSITMGRGHYHFQHEGAWYAVRKGGTSAWIGDHSQSTVLKIDREDGNHPTVKPLECMARPIRNHDSEFVYEPFSGSGTTIIACENLKRKCRAIEISPGYVGVTLQRWADHTGQTPTRILNAP